MPADIPTSSWEASETGKIERSQPRRSTPGRPFSPICFDPRSLPEYDVVSRRTNAGSQFYDFSAHGVLWIVAFLVSGLSERPESVIRTARLSLFPPKVLLAT